MRLLFSGCRNVMDAADLKRIKRIVVRSPNWVGDAVLTTPAIRAVRQGLPNAQITVLAKPWVAPVFYSNPDIDEVFLYDAKERHRGWFGKARLARELRKIGFDLAVLFQNAFEAALLTCLAGVPRRLGYDTDGRSPFLTHCVALSKNHKQGHQIDYYLGILEGASLKVSSRDLILVLTEEDRASAQVILRRRGIEEKDRLVAINPGAAYGSAKRWPAERYAALCDRIQTQWKVKTIILGGPGEESVGLHISKLMKQPCVSLCGETSLREAAAVIERCHLFVTNDSGLMHIAAALDIPLIALFGPTDPVATGPANPRSQVVQVPTSCSPCLKRECPEDHRCMERITVERVHGVASAFLNRTSEPIPRSLPQGIFNSGDHRG